MYQRHCAKAMFLTACVALTITASAPGKSLKAPPGMFKDLNDEIVGDAIIINGKQLFIDDYIIEHLEEVRKVLNQPTKHPRNPLVIRDRAWEGYAITHGSVVRDAKTGAYQLWYNLWQGTLEDEKKGVSVSQIGYAISPDGIKWEKPLDDIVKFKPSFVRVGGPSVLVDPGETDPNRRYKMLVVTRAGLGTGSLSICAAYSADGRDWQQEPHNPVASFGDGPPSLYWDGRRQRYVAHPRFSPPNTRKIAQIESEDFVHWTPKFKVVDHSGKLDKPFRTAFQMMAAMPYEGVYVGLLNAHHGETIQPIPKDKPWMDKINVQLTFSRNGVTWQRVGPHGAIPADQQYSDEQWKQIAEGSVFLPYGEYKKDWDWGWVNSFEPPLVLVGDEIRIYYFGVPGHHWWNYHGDAPVGQSPREGFGLATLRLDGFVSINAEKEGTMTTKPFVFIGDTLEINANAAGGSIRVEALDPEGKVIEGFAKKDCTAITTDSVRHVLKWNGKTDCQLIQARPIKLRFYLKKAKLYSFTPRIRYKHYIPSYD